MKKPALKHPSLEKTGLRTAEKAGRRTGKKTGLRPVHLGQAAAFLFAAALFAAPAGASETPPLDAQAMQMATPAQKGDDSQEATGVPHHHHMKHDDAQAASDNMSPASSKSGPPAVAQPYFSPLRGYRRTLFMSIGQHRVTLEAPVGMCFLDQSDYLQSTVMDYINDKSNQADSVIVATFADCNELTNMQHQFQLDSVAAAKGSNPQDVEPDSSMMPRSGGTVAWLNPDNPDDDEQVVLARDQYLDLREKDYRDDIVKANTPRSQHGKMTAASFMSEEGQIQFDDKARRTKDGLSLAYSKHEEVEYQKLHTMAVVGTTLLHQVPLEFTFSFTTKEPLEQDSPPDKDFKTLYATMDTFLAQQALMNDKKKLSF